MSLEIDPKFGIIAWPWLFSIVPPDIQLEKTSSDTTVNEGEDATLVCHASGRPQPTIIWRREDGKSFHVRNTKKMGKWRKVSLTRLSENSNLGCVLLQCLNIWANFWYCIVLEEKIWVHFYALPKTTYPLLWANELCWMWIVRIDNAFFAWCSKSFALT